MHKHIINASLQILPIAQDKHHYVWVDEAIEIIRASSVKFDVGPFATTLEGTYDDVLKVIHDVNEYLLEQACPEWIASVQIQIRCDQDITALEKIEKYQSQ